MIYEGMARYYDSLTDDVPYTEFADFYEKLFAKYKVAPKLVLDLACGTGSLTAVMAGRGYEMIGLDASPDMLAVAEEKVRELEPKPIFVCQNMTKADLYGTCDAAVSCLDGINYLQNKKELYKAFSRLSLFIEPGGLFIFDVNSEAKLRGIGGNCYVRENEELGVYCVWESFWDEKSKVATYAVEIFKSDENGRYERFSELHREKAYTKEELTEALESSGFETPDFYGNLKLRKPKEDEDRIVVVTKRKKNDSGLSRK